MRRRKGISSIYGFIMIFLLSMASIQTWSYAVSSMASEENAAAQQQQVQQLQSIEHLSLYESDGNITITNTGQIPSTVEVLRYVGPNNSRTVDVDAALPVGSSITEPAAPGYTVQVVTSLGNVFAYSPSSDPGVSYWSGTVPEGGMSNLQIFQSPYLQGSFYLSDGPSVFAFSSSGVAEWSFDSGDGYVTDVLPLSNGDVYVSSGYGSTSNIATLFELSPSGQVIATYAVRLLQTPDGASEAPSVPVVKGEDSLYAYYDGWFYSATGPSASLTSDAFPLAGSDSSNFFFYRITAVPYDDGTCQLPGDEFLLYSYTLGPVYGNVTKEDWDDYIYTGQCSRFPPQVAGSAVGGGVIAALLTSPAFAASPEEAYPSGNPYLVIATTHGVTLYDGQTPAVAYTSVATNGTDVYLSLPQQGEIQTYSLTSGGYTTYDVGIQASQLLFQDGSLFAISDDQVRVFSPSMVLEKTIDFAPLSLASSSDSFLQETALQAPSFLVLNSTSYAALLVNNTGSASLVLGSY